MPTNSSLGFITHTPIYASQQQITFTTASGSSSSALPAGATVVRISANTAIWYAVGISASAAAGTYLPANTVEYAPVSGAVVINVLGVTTAGSAWVTPCSQ